VILRYDAKKTMNPPEPMSYRHRWFLTHVWGMKSARQMADRMGTNRCRLIMMAKDLDLPYPPKPLPFQADTVTVAPVPGLRYRCQSCEQLVCRCAAP
jgi:hypothetical protein